MWVIRRCSYKNDQWSQSNQTNGMQSNKIIWSKPQTSIEAREFATVATKENKKYGWQIPHRKTTFKHHTYTHEFDNVFLFLSYPDKNILKQFFK